MLKGCGGSGGRANQDGGFVAWEPCFGCPECAPEKYTDTPPSTPQPQRWIRPRALSKEGEMEAAEVAAKLRTELGWYAWANDIEKGRANQSDLADALDSHVKEKEDWLKRHTFQPNTEAEGRHHRMTLWCERARALITAMQGGGGDGDA